MYTLEKLYEIWDDSTGECIEVGPDRDGLDLIEIREMDGKKVVARITLNNEKAELLIKALLDITKQE